MLIKKPPRSKSVTKVLKSTNKIKEKSPRWSKKCHLSKKFWVIKIKGHHKNKNRGSWSKSSRPTIRKPLYLDKILNFSLKRATGTFYSPVYRIPPNLLFTHSTSLNSTQIKIFSFSKTFYKKARSILFLDQIPSPLSLNTINYRFSISKSTL